MLTEKQRCKVALDKFSCDMRFEAMSKTRHGGCCASCRWLCQLTSPRNIKQTLTDHSSQRDFGKNGVCGRMEL